MTCGVSRIRKQFQSTIQELSASISYNDEQYARTGDPNFAKFRDDNIKTLRDLKEYILKCEAEEAARYPTSNEEVQLELFDDE